MYKECIGPSSLAFKVLAHSSKMVAKTVTSTIKDIPSDATFTSQPQSWHILIATSIFPIPVMGTHYTKAATDRSGERNRDLVKCKLYEARGPKLRQVDVQHVLSNVEMMRIKNKPHHFIIC